MRGRKDVKPVLPAAASILPDAQKDTNEIKTSYGRLLRDLI